MRILLVISFFILRCGIAFAQHINLPKNELEEFLKFLPNKTQQTHAGGAIGTVNNKTTFNLSLILNVEKTDSIYRDDDSLILVNQRNRFDMYNSYYKVLIIPDVIHKEDNTVLIKHQLDNFSERYNLNVYSCVLDKKVKLKHEDGIPYYDWLMRYTNADAIITSSYESLSSDRNICNVNFVYRCFDSIVNVTHDTLTVSVDSFFQNDTIIVTHKIKVLSNNFVEPKFSKFSLNAVEISKKEFFRGCFLNEVKSSIVNYYLSNCYCDSSIDKQRYYTILRDIYPAKAYPYEIELNGEIISCYSRWYNKMPVVIAIVDSVLKYDSLSYNGLFYKTLIGILQYDIMYMPDSIIYSNIQKIGKFGYGNSIDELFLKYIYYYKTNNFDSIITLYPRIDILYKTQFQSRIQFSFTNENSNRYFVYYSAFCLDTNNHAYLDSAYNYVFNKECIQNNISCSDSLSYLKFLLDKFYTSINCFDICFLKKDTINAKNFEREIFNIYNKIDSNLLQKLFQMKLLKSPFNLERYSSLKYSPKDLFVGSGGLFYRVKLSQAYYSDNWDSINKYIQLLENLPHMYFTLSSREDSLSFFYPTLAYDLGISDLIADFGLYTFKKGFCDLSEQYLGWYYYYYKINLTEMEISHTYLDNKNHEFLIDLFTIYLDKKSYSNCSNILNEYVGPLIQKKLLDKQKALEWIELFRYNFRQLKSNHCHTESIKNFFKVNYL